MTFRRSSANAPCSCRVRRAMPQVGPQVGPQVEPQVESRGRSRAGSLRRGGRSGMAVTAALRRHGRPEQSLTARLMGDPPPGRSALETRGRSPAQPIPSIRHFDRDILFSGPVELIDAADPYEDLDPGALAGPAAPGE